MQIAVGDNARTAEQEKEQIKKAKPQNAQMKMSNIRGILGFGDQDGLELDEKVKNLEHVVVDNEKLIKEMRKESIA